MQPNEAEAAIEADQSVLTNLASNDDRADQARPVDHFSYFPNKNAAQRFADWAESQGFTKTTMGEDAASGTFLVQLQHVGTMVESDILAKTRLLREKSTEFGGKYDGWGTVIIR